jgi:hypothetical protein
VTTIDDAVDKLKQGDYLNICYNHAFPFNLLGRDRFIAKYQSHNPNNRTLKVMRTVRSNKVFQLSTEYTLLYDRIANLTRLNPENLFNTGDKPQ